MIIRTFAGLKVSLTLLIAVRLRSIVHSRAQIMFRKIEAVEKPARRTLRPTNRVDEQAVTISIKVGAALARPAD